MRKSGILNISEFLVLLVETAYGHMEFRSKMNKKIILRPLRTCVHWNIQQLALEVWTQLGKIQK